jgi:polyisoprenoid-binding protein YceI
MNAQTSIQPKETTPMRHSTAAAVAAVSLLSALPAQSADAATYSVDKTHSEASFQIRHLVSKVRGGFEDFSGTIQLDRQNVERSSVEFTIAAASIDTAVPDRDAHLRGADFFDAEKHPEITFSSTRVVPDGEDRFQVTGDLTMRGVTRQITLPVEYTGEVRDPWGNVKAGFETGTTLNRKDFGMIWNAALDQGGVVLGDEVKITINLETKLEEPAKQAAK